MKNYIQNFRYQSLLMGLFIAFSTTLSGCTASATEENAAGSAVREPIKINSHLLVFIDKTMSNTIEAQVLANQEKSLRGLIREHFKTNGDFVGAYAIHSSTGPGSNIIQVKLDEKADTIGVGAQTKQQRVSDLKTRIDGKVNSCFKACKAELSSLNSQPSNQQTDLWATLNLIGRHTRSLPRQDKVTVVYFSDMIESMDGKSRRDFHKNPITTPEEARKLAAQDLKTIQENYLVEIPEDAGNVTVKIWLPYGSHATNNATNMVAYWEEIFRQLGMKTEPARS